ncbi:hypothetical protein ES702_03117 [subsurface metagenome]
MPQKRKSGYALDDDDDLNTFDGPATETTTKRSASKRSKKTTSATPPTDAAPIITSAHFADVPTSQSAKTDTEGNLYWDISKARRVTLSDFRGKKMVGIREYYEKDGQMLPGKKGISMTLEQYGVLVSLLPGIEGELRKGGITEVPRPDYEKMGDDRGEEIDEDEDDDAGQGKGGTRPNHEATSDEED